MRTPPAIDSAMDQLADLLRINEDDADSVGANIDAYNGISLC